MEPEVFVSRRSAGGRSTTGSIPASSTANSTPSPCGTDLGDGRRRSWTPTRRSSTIGWPRTRSSRRPGCTGRCGSRAIRVRWTSPTSCCRGASGTRWWWCWATRGCCGSSTTSGRWRRWCAGSGGAFAFLGGVPAELLFDQMRAVVVGDGRSEGGRLLENREFLRFSALRDYDRLAVPMHLPDDLLGTRSPLVVRPPSHRPSRCSRRYWNRPSPRASAGHRGTASTR